MALRSSPAYKTLADALRERIHAADFPPGQRLPTEAELTETYGVSRQTARRAFSDLVAEGLVYRVPGRGTFALTSANDKQYLRSFGSIDDLLALSVDTELEIVRPFAKVVDVPAAGRLGLPTDEVVSGTFRRFHGEAPFSLTTVALPLDIGRHVLTDPRVPSPGDRCAITMIELVGEYSPNPIAGAHQSVTATLADPETAALIECATGDPILGIDRSYFDTDGRLVELAVSIFNVKRYSYRVELRRSVR